MTAAPLLPENAPFSLEGMGVLNKVVSRTTWLQRSWFTGLSRASRRRKPLRVFPADEFNAALDSWAPPSDSRKSE